MLVDANVLLKYVFIFNCHIITVHSIGYVMTFLYTYATSNDQVRVIDLFFTPNIYHLLVCL
jgi:hypothetical protein